jgi:PAS domain S-box-containing protein
MQDRTSQKQTEDSLRASEAEFRAVFEQSAVGMTQVCARTGRFLRVNAKFCELTGYSAEELATMTPKRLDVVEDRGSDLKIIGALLSGEIASYNLEKRYLRKDGKQVWVHANATLVRNNEGQPKLTVGVIQDITERKRVEQQLRELAAQLSEADCRKDEFLATLAHELRNPLAPIRNALQLMKLVGGEHPTMTQARAIMERQLTHMVRLVDDLMDVSRISRGVIELRKAQVSLADVLSSAVESSRPLIEQMGHDLIVTLPQQTVIVDADLTRLAQVPEPAEQRCQVQ